MHILFFSCVVMRQRGKQPSGLAGEGGTQCSSGRVYKEYRRPRLEDLEGPLNEDSIRAKYKYV